MTTWSGQPHPQDGYIGPEFGANTLIATGGTSALSLSYRFGNILSVTDFGVVGDGVADDSTALLAAWAYMKANGGVLVDSRGLTMRTGNLSGTGATKSWAFIGTRGQTRFVRKDDTVGTLFSCASSSVPFEYHNFTVDCKHATFPNGSHGVSIADTTGFRITGVDVVDYKSTGILVFATSVNTYSNCIVEDCTTTSTALAALNGILLAELNNSGIVNCSAYGALGGSPGYGIQLKNDCRRCYITNSHAERCISGLAFGNDSGTSGVKYSTIMNLSAYKCTNGMIGSFAEKNQVTGLFVDMDSLGEGAIDLQDGCIGNHVDATVINVAAVKGASRFRSGAVDNTVHFGFVDNINSTGKVAIFDSGALRNTVLLDRITNPTLPTGGPQGLVSNNSTSNDNSFNYLVYPNYLQITLASDTATVKDPLATSLVLDTEAAAGTDNLATITGVAYEGQTLSIRSLSSARDIVVKHNTGNIVLNGAADFTLGDPADTVSLRYNITSNKWCEVGRGDNL